MAEAVLVYRMRQPDNTVHEVCCECRVSLESAPFAHGAMRQAYKMQIAGDDRVYVAKEFFSLPGRNLRKLFHEQMDAQHAAQHLADLFNQQKPPRPVNFLDVFLVHVLGGPGPRTLLCEPYLDGEYQKHNCSNGWLPDALRSTPQAFTHFTFCVTKGNMLVVDLQGVGDVYTDPVVLTRDGRGFGLGNIGVEGMDMFFASHRCNPLCMKLGLTPVFGPLIESSPTLDLQ